VQLWRLKKHKTMYYKYIDENNIIAAPNAQKKIKTESGNTIYCPSIEQLNENNYFIYVKPVLTKYQKAGKLIKVDQTITNEVVEMTPEEKHAVDIAERVKELEWLYPEQNIRITAVHSLTERQLNGSPNPLTYFSENIERRKLPYIYDEKNRKYTAYISEFLENEKEALESLPEYPDWIENKDLIIEYLYSTI